MLVTGAPARPRDAPVGRCGNPIHAGMTVVWSVLIPAHRWTGGIVRWGKPAFSKPGEPGVNIGAYDGAS